MKWLYRPILLLTLLITTACKPSDPEQARPTIPAELASLNADLAWLRSQPGFAEIVSAGEGSVVGSKICRLPPGPHDTKYYRIRLDEGGRISGEGSISGATGMLEFTDGQWREQGDSIQLQLRFEGMRSEPGDGGAKQVKTSESIELAVPVARLKQAGECYEVE
jgi:hypothetical protein